MLRFSQRIGKTPVQETVQLDGMDDRLRNRLFNRAEEAVKDRFTISEGILYVKRDFLYSYCDYFGELFSEKSDLYGHFRDELSLKIKNNDTFFLYDFLEFVVDEYGYQVEYLIASFNEILEQEKSGYRFDTDGRLLQITSQTELDEVNRASEWKGKYTGVYEHLAKAREFFSNRESPDYKKSIAESVHAVEAVSRIILNEPNATLGALVKKLTVHPNLKESIEKLYGFASDVGGIRHWNKDRGTEKDNEIDKVCIDEARVILVLSHAITNYLISKFL